MKKLVTKGAAISAVLIAGQANAAVPLTGAGVPDIAAITAAGFHETFLTGSSAASPFMENAMDLECDGTIYKYANSGNKVYICQKAASLTTVAETYLVMQKRDGGGSINGVKAILGVDQTFIDLNSLASATSCGTPAGVFSTCNGTLTNKTVNIANQPIAGFADVDPAQFQSPLNGGLANASSVSATAVATQVFGIVVNTDLRNAMQAAEKAAGTLAADCVGNEEERCMPNLTSEQVSSIFAAGRVTDWAQFRYGTTSGTQNLVSAAAGASLAVPGNRDIHICTRTAGSGTLATLQVKFENAPCNGAINEAIQTASSQTLGTESGASGSKKVVHSMSGSGDVEDCLEGLNAGAATGTFTPYPVSGKRWGIGIMGTERNAANGKNYRFVKIDGYSPASHNVVEGKYKFWGELVNAGTPSDPLAIDMIKNMSSPIKIASLAVNSTNFGVTGYLGIANNPDSAMLPTTTTAINGLANAAFDPARPVNPYTHANAAGGSLNHCRVPTIPAGQTRAIPAFY